MQRRKDDDLFGEVESWNASMARSEALGTLAELNRQYLDLLAEQALEPNTPAKAPWRQVSEIWRELDTDAKERAASCPYLLLDAGFCDPYRWRAVEDHRIHEPAKATYGSFFTVPNAAAVARRVFVYAWHVVRSKHCSPQLFLGMPPHCAEVISGRTLLQMDELGERHADWMRPRWVNRIKVWRSLLRAAASDDVVALESARMHGLQLLAAECRAAAIQVIRRGDLRSDG